MYIISLLYFIMHGRKKNSIKGNKPWLYISFIFCMFRLLFAVLIILRPEYKGTRHHKY